MEIDNRIITSAVSESFYYILTSKNYYHIKHNSLKVVMNLNRNENQQ